MVQGQTLVKDEQQSVKVYKITPLFYELQSVTYYKRQHRVMVTLTEKCTQHTGTHRNTQRTLIAH